MHQLIRVGLVVLGLVIGAAVTRRPGGSRSTRVAGALVMRARREPLSILLAPPLLVTITTLTGYGTTRFRHAAEMSIVVLASVALVAAWDNRDRVGAVGLRETAEAGPPR